MVADRCVAGDGLHDADLGGAHVVGEVLVVGGGSGQREEDGVAEEGDAVLHADHHLLPDPLGDQIVAEDDHGGSGNEPESEKQEEWIVEATLSIIQRKLVEDNYKYV